MNDVLRYIVNSVLEEEPVTMAEKWALGAVLEADRVDAIPERKVFRALGQSIQPVPVRVKQK